MCAFVRTLHSLFISYKPQKVNIKRKIPFAELNLNTAKGILFSYFGENRVYRKTSVVSEAVRAGAHRYDTVIAFERIGNAL